MRSIVRIVGLALAAGIAACGSGGILAQYEYEEEIYLDLDGSATVIVNSSLPALVALRGLDLDPDPSARVDRRHIRELFETPFSDVVRVSRPWRRDGRRFVQVRLEVDDIRELGRARPFDWSEYRLERQEDLVVYRQRVAAPEGQPVGDVGWEGDELVAFRLHLPSRIEYHNAPSKRVERGNILEWEQPLEARLRGEPLDLEVRMGSSSILSTTLTLFGLAFASAMLVLAALIWWTMRKGEAEAA